MVRADGQQPVKAKPSIRAFAMDGQQPMKAKPTPSHQPLTAKAGSTRPTPPNQGSGGRK
jgi:hypothetical protein